jgi:hypothetical protein
MSTQELYEIADWETRLNLADADLMNAALIEANGNKTFATQVYWRLRADSIRAEAGKLPDEQSRLFLQELHWRLQTAYKLKCRNDAIAGWAWATICFLSFAATTISSYSALGSIAQGGLKLYLWSAIFLVFLLVTIAAYVKAKKNACQDPFAP